MELRHVRIDPSDRALIDRWLDLCQPEERDRYRRLLVEPARTRFALSRLAIRLVLSDELGSKPADVRLGAAGSGQPIVDGIPHVSWSRSTGHVLIGTEATFDLGVDIEADSGAPRLTEDLWDLIASPSEQALAGEPNAVLRLWTLKESAVKAVGLGLQLDVRSLISLERLPDPGENVKLLDGWTSQVVDVGAGAFAAITSRCSESPRLRTTDLVELAGALR